MQIAKISSNNLLISPTALRVSWNTVFDDNENSVFITSHLVIINRYQSLILINMLKI